MDKSERFVLAALLLGFLAVSAYLPSAGAGVYSSPDETANAVAAEQMATHGSAVMAAVGDAEGFPWVHPRSWIGLPGKIAPVGFFGWPVLLALFRRVFGAWILPWVGGWILVSAIIPFYFLLRKKFDVAASAIGVIVAFSFPTMILYANRGLFSNGPVLALGLWTFWLLLREHKWNRCNTLFIGALAGMTIAIRPIEAAWLFPWWGLALVKNQQSLTLKIGMMFGAGFLFGALPSAVFAWGAYGSPLAVGYWMRETVTPTAVGIAASAPASVLPFGIHPRNIWWNIRAFLFGIAWPWTTLMICFVLARRITPPNPLLRQEGEKGVLTIRKMEHWYELLLPACTIAWLLILYGSGLYADHVRVGAATVGNSFLRYMMPMALFAGWAAASLMPRVRPAWMRVALVIGIAIFGGWRAFAADDEGLRFVKQELLRYRNIRQETSALLSPDAVIFSERSDKIFFPTFRAVSPMPQKEQIARFAAASHPSLALFSRPLSQRDKDDWMSVGLETQEVKPFGRETLYRLVLRSASP